MTAEQSRLNMKTAAANVRAAMGLPEDRTRWTYEQRNAYLRQLAEYVLRFPQSFTPETLATAQSVAGKTFQPLDDTSLDWGEFREEVIANGAALATFSGKTIIVLGAVAAFLFFRPHLQALAKALK